MGRENSLELPVCPSCDLYIQFGTKIAECNECGEVMHFRCYAMPVQCVCGSDNVTLSRLHPNFEEFQMILKHITEIMDANLMADGILEEFCSKYGISSNHVQGFRNTYCSLKQNNEMVNSELCTQIRKLSHSLLDLCRIIMFCIFAFFVAGIFVYFVNVYYSIGLLSFSLMCALFFYCYQPVIDPYALLETAQKGPEHCFPCHNLKILLNEKTNIIDEAWEEFCMVEHLAKEETCVESQPL